jgi:ADP-ribosyl-[dinitrogen reductase] hydrolase
MTLNDEQLARAKGAIVGAAAGDALGAGYEFAEIVPGLVPGMIGGGLGPFAPGEWTDDTSMTYGILEAGARVTDLSSEEGLAEISKNFLEWFATGPPDIGGTTAWALRAGESMQEAAAERAGYTNGSLMRTAPVALAFLERSPEELAAAAVKVSSLTHAGASATSACAVWCLAIRHAVLEGEYDIRQGLQYLEPAVAEIWEGLLNDAEERTPNTFAPNGSAVRALQAAWSSIHWTSGKDFQETLTRVVRIGDDTDTVASIAGALLGAKLGVDAVPSEWRDILHGYPGKTAQDLEDLVTLIV